MTRKKTESFDATSPLRIADKENRTNNKGNLQVEWARLSEQREGVYIDDKSLHTYQANYNYFRTEEDVKRFFKEIILAKAKLGDTEKDQAVEYLAIYFQQAGFLFPVSNTLLFALQPSNKTYGMIATFEDKLIDIKTSAKGFQIQEFVKVSKLTATQGKTVQEFMPKEDHEYVIKAEGTIHLDFTKKPEDPSINIISNKISYGRDDIKSSMDSRSFLQWLQDFFTNLIGINKAELIDTTPDENQSHSNTHERPMGP